MPTGRIHRALVELTVAETASVSEALKRGGYGFGHLVEAATAMALYNLKPVPEDQKETAHVTFGASMYARPRSTHFMFSRLCSIAGSRSM